MDIKKIDMSNLTSEQKEALFELLGMDPIKPEDEELIKKCKEKTDKSAYASSKTVKCDALIKMMRGICDDFEAHVKDDKGFEQGIFLCWGKNATEEQLRNARYLWDMQNHNLLVNELERIMQKIRDFNKNQ